MLYYLSSSDNPYFNQALEEYFLTTLDDDIVFCYVNRPSLVVGRFQVAYREADAAFLHKTNMSVVRRLSGGGSVYHDSGNLNYAFIQNVDDSVGDRYSYFNDITLAVLSSLGLSDLSFERNNIFCEGKKISGVAQYKRGKRIVHHGTLLVDADLDKLRRLFVTKDYYLTKGIASVSSHVSNFTEFIAVDMQQVLDGFNALCDGILFFDAADSVEKKAEIYASKEWILGKSPDYSVLRDKLEITVKKGKISDVNLTSLSNIVGVYHCYNDLKSLCSDVDVLF